MNKSDDIMEMDLLELLVQKDPDLFEPTGTVLSSIRECDNFVHINRPPTKEDYFTAKLGNLPLKIESSLDIINFNLIDMDQEIPFQVDLFPEYHLSLGQTYNLWDIQYRNNIDVACYVGGHTILVKNLYFPEKWLQVNFPDLLKRWHRILNTVN